MKIKEAGERPEAGGAKEPSTFHLKPATKRSAFTLIEMVGVMALIAILAAVAVPPLISRLETVDSAKEDANLEEIARALAEGIKATGTIPNPALAAGVSGSWTAIASNYTLLAPRLLATNFPARNARQIVFSPDLTSFVAANGFVTPATGWPDPLPAGDMRIYILASSKRNLPLLSGIPVADIADWDKVYSNTGVIPVPSSVFGPNQTNKGEFLHVTSINLRPLFCKVELIDTACPPTATITTIGNYKYANPSISFFSGVAVFDIFDSTSSPITPARILLSTDQAILRSSYSQFLDRASALVAVIIPGGTPPEEGATPLQAEVTPALNSQPRFRIPISQSVSPPPPGMFPANIQAFYVLKGTTLQLWDSSSASPVLTTTIELDCTFKFFGNTWTRVD